MTAQAEAQSLQMVCMGALSKMNAQPVYAAKSLFMSQMVSAITASGYMSDPAYGTTGAVLGFVEADSIAVSGESSGDRGVNLVCGAKWVANHRTHPVLLTHIGAVCYASDNATVSRTSTDGPVAGVVCGVDSTLGVLVYVHPGLNYLLSQATLSSNLASTTTSLGASLIGVEDAGGYTTSATVEACLAELYGWAKVGTIPLSLYVFRECDANGDVGNIAANGGILASDTTPIMRGDAAESAEISWAASNSDPITTQISLPADFDDTADCYVDCWVYSGTTDAASIVIETSWNGGALVSDALDDSSTKSATVHLVTATIANGDIPANSKYVTIALTPPAHTTDAIQLTAIRLRYSRKLS